MPKGEMSCDHCHNEILPEWGYVEIDVTYWSDESTGSSVKEVYHKTCPRVKDTG